jgi:hypothetical protein
VVVFGYLSWGCGAGLVVYPEANDSQTGCETGLAETYVFVRHVLDDTIDEVTRESILDDLYPPGEISR